MKKKQTKNNGRKPIKKMYKVTAALSIALIILLGAFAILRKPIVNARLTAEDLARADISYNGVKAIGMVNGEPFFEFDLNVYAMELRAAVAAHYGRVYGLAGMGASFWEQDFDGQTPRQFLERLARDDMVRNMIIIQEARKRGIDTPDVFHDLEIEREAWNAPTDDIVYGPRTLAPAEYHSYRITGIKNALMTDLLRNELEPTVAQMRASYNTLNDSLKIAHILVDLIRYSWDESPLSNDEARAMIEHGARRGFTPEEIVNNLSGSIPGLMHEEFESHSRYVSKEDEYEQALASSFAEMPIGSFVTGPEDRPEFFFILRREGGHIMPFEEAPGLGRNKWINDQFEIFIDRKIKEARITMFPDNRS